MPIQTTYGFSYPTRQKGFATNLISDNDYTGYASVDIGFGLGVCSSGTSSDTRLGLKLPSAAADTFLGVTVLVHKQPYGTPADLNVLNDTQTSYYRAAEAIKYKRKGQICVYAESAVNPTLPVFLRFAVNGALTVGNFRTDADGTNAFALTRARWVETTTAAGLAIIELDY
jgi:hypothetical protein